MDKMAVENDYLVEGIRGNNYVFEEVVTTSL